MNIATKNKDVFLKTEYDQSFKLLNMWDTFYLFRVGVEDMVKECSKCKINYWQGCQKRCNCN